MDDPPHNLVRDVAGPPGAIFVVGSGVTAAATAGSKLASWAGLIDDGIERSRRVGQPEEWASAQRALLALGDLTSLTNVAHAVTEALGGPEGREFRRWLRETVGSFEMVDDRILRALTQSGAPLATTNYDHLLTAASGLDPVAWTRQGAVDEILLGGERGVLHLHGEYKTPESVIFGTASYAGVVADRHAQAVQQALSMTRPLVFVGFGEGLNDPNFHALRRWAAEVRRPSAGYRLARESEVPQLQHAHAAASDGITVVPYGAQHEDLAPFLEALLSAASAEGHVASSPPLAVASLGTGLPSRRQLFGREDEVNALAKAVLEDSPRPVAVLGPPGIGKSAISRAVAYDPRVARHFGARRYWIRCDGIASASALLAQVARALDIDVGAAMENAVRSTLRVAPALVILDNAETPWEAEALEVEELLLSLADIPTVALIASIRGSQRPLGGWREPIDVPRLPRAHARELFLTTASARFASDPHLDDLLSDLDGMPLAIELLGFAAQASPDLSDVRARWDALRASLLARGSQPDRQLSLAVSVELSLKSPRMTPHGLELLKVLAALPDGMANDDVARAFPYGLAASATLRGSGLAFNEGQRLRILKPIRDYISATYDPRSEDWNRAADLYAQMTLELGPAVGRPNGADAARALGQELGNVLVVISSLLRGDKRKGVDVALALSQYAVMAGVDLDTTLADAEAAADALGEASLRAHVVHERARTANGHGDAQSGMTFARRAAELFEAGDDHVATAQALTTLGDAALFADALPEGIEAYERALQLFTAAGSADATAPLLVGLSNAELRRRNLPGAVAHADKAAEMFRERGDPLGEANALRAAAAAEQVIDPPSATKKLLEARSLYANVGDPMGEGSTLRGLAQIAIGEGKAADALKLLDAAEPLLVEGGVQGLLSSVASIRAAAYLALGESGAAKTQADNAIKIAVDVNDRHSEANARVSRARVAVALSQPEDAAEQLERAETTFHLIHDEGGAAWVRRVRGRLGLPERSP